jgi:hypothetical protein
MKVKPQAATAVIELLMMLHIQCFKHLTILKRVTTS